MIKIDKNVPMPEMRRGVKKYPWKEMKVGDSFLIHGKTTPTMAHSGAKNASRRLAPKKFKARKVDEGYRLWRIE